MICYLCNFYFSATPTGQKERICPRRPLVKGNIQLINEYSTACKDNFKSTTYFYCPVLTYFMPLATCLKNRRQDECPTCPVGPHAVKLYRKSKDDV